MALSDLYLGKTMALLRSISFGLLPQDSIPSICVAEVTSAKPDTGVTPNDEIFGVVESGVVCPTCKRQNDACPGHYGYIRLNQKVAHPLLFKEILHFLQIFCFSDRCSRLLVTKEQLELIPGYKPGVICIPLEQCLNSSLSSA